MDPDLVTLKSLKTRLVPFQHLSKSGSHNMIINHIPARVTYISYFLPRNSSKTRGFITVFYQPLKNSKLV